MGGPDTSRLFSWGYGSWRGMCFSFSKHTDMYTHTLHSYRAWEAVQSVKCLLCKYEALRSVKWKLKGSLESQLCWMVFF